MLASIGAAQDKPPPQLPSIGLDGLFRQPYGPMLQAPQRSSKTITRCSRTVLNQRLTDLEYFAENAMNAASFDYDENLDPIHSGILSSEEATSLFEL